MERKDAERIVALLSAAFPQYPMEQDTVSLYVRSMVEQNVDADLALHVTAEWITTQLTFPKIAEIVEQCDHEKQRRINRARAIAAGQAHPHGDGTVSCTACGDSKWERHDVDDEVKARHFSYTELTYVLPCRACDPIRHEFWRDGHLDPSHSVASCDHPWCVAKAKRGAKKRRVGQFVDEPSRVSASADAYVGPGF